MRDNIRYGLWVIAGAIWCTLCFVLPDFLDNPAADWQSRLIIGLYAIVVGAVSGLILMIAGSHRIAAAILLPIYGIGGAMISYYRVAYHATITPMVIEATLHTNTGTIAGVMSWQLMVWIILHFAVAIAFVVYRWRYIRLQRGWIYALVGIVMLTVYHHAEERLEQSINQRYPMNVANSTVKYLQQRHAISQHRTLLPYKNVAAVDSMDIVFVLGEALRADHLSLNGYERETCPRLRQQPNAFSYGNIYSEYTYTSASVPHILTPADSAHTDRSYSYHSFIQTLRNEGYASAWLSNQDLGYTYSTFIHEADTVIFPNAQKSVFVYDPWYDEQLLSPLDALMAHGKAKNIYVLHTIGSHWYYDYHVTPEFQQFMPVTTNRVVTKNTAEQVINSYDNTALYADMLIDSLICRLQEKTAVLIYLSDHGEALGEDGNWLHAGSVDAMRRPACIVWYSDCWAQRFPEKAAAIQANKDRYYRTDFLYYSLLNMAGIEAEGDNEKVDICRK